MKINRNIPRYLTIAFWCCIIASTLVLVVAAVKSKSEQICAGFEINIKEPVSGQWFVEKNDIFRLLTIEGTEQIKGKQLHKFDLKKMEERLKKDIWIKDAQLFFDNRSVLLVKISQRVPVARIFTVGGNSFYIDSAAKKLPLSRKISARLPVFTGFPVEKVRLQRDSILLLQVKELSSFILGDPFWMAQVAQVDITSNREYEIIPTIGNHIIQFGNGNDIEKKFRKLMLFYQQVIVKTGFEKYKVINIQYIDQVIGVKKEEGNVQKPNYSNN